MSSLSDVLKVLDGERLHLQEWPALPAAPAAAPILPVANGVRQRAEDIEAEAREKARQLLMAAQAKADHIYAEARNAGYEEGFRAGQAEAVAGVRSRLRLTLTELRRLVAQVVDERHQLLATTSSGVLELATALARKILASEVDGDPERLLPMLAQARAKLQPASGETVTVYGNPADLERLAKTEGTAAWPGTRFVADAGLARGDLILESRRGRLDLRLEAQLQRLVGYLEGSLGPESAPTGYPADGEGGDYDSDG